MFYCKENRIWHFMQWRQFAWNANPVFLEEWEKYFKMSSVENFTQNVKCYGLHKQIAHGSAWQKPIITCMKRRISLHTLSLHISSLIRAFANHMYRLQSMGLTKRLVWWAKTRVSLRNCTFWSEHSLIVFTFDSRAVQSGINSVTVTSHSDQTLRWSYSMHLLRTAGYPRSLLYIVGRCTDWPESLLDARTLYYSTFCRLVHCKNIVNHTFVPT